MSCPSCWFNPQRSRSLIRLLGLVACLAWMTGSALAQPAPVFRPADRRPKHNDKQLADIGIKSFESKRLLLYTDVDSPDAKNIPPLVDQLYDALEKYFGKLPANPAGTPFQVTGYVMKDKVLFERAGLLPADLPPFHHGRHSGQQFWMFEQKFDYYRRHLVLHEFTHCFMTIMPGHKAPVWYLEGMAEYFGTHEIAKDGKATFGIMPAKPEAVPGWGRISLIREDNEAGRFLSVSAVQRQGPFEYRKPNAYAWTWALCCFFETHPLYAKRFRQAGRTLMSGRFARSFRETFAEEAEAIRFEWMMFALGLKYGFDHSRAWVKFRKGIACEGVCRFRVFAKRGWQSSGLSVKKGESYRVVAAGRFTLADAPKPWVSEADGITIRYFGGIPLGRLVLLIHDEQSISGIPWKTLPVGSRATFTAPISGTVYFRLNDDWSDLSDNRGAVRVILEPSAQE